MKNTQRIWSIVGIVVGLGLISYVFDFDPMFLKGIVLIIGVLVLISGTLKFISSLELFD